MKVIIYNVILFNQLYDLFEKLNKYIYMCTNSKYAHKKNSGDK